jgi:predicted neutral ceramidase superfamily lipid hydrolase
MGVVGVAFFLLVIKFVFQAPIDVSSIIFVSFGGLLGAYLVSRVWERRSEIRILRMGYIAGGVVLGMFAWSFIVIPLDFVMNLPGGFLGGVIAFLLLPVLMAIGAVTMDAVGKRRDYRPFMEGRGGNI